MQQEFKTYISKLDYLTDDVILMTCTLDDPTEINFQAGNFVMITFPNPNGEPVSRLYSIASSPNQEHALDFIIKIVPGGKGTSLIQYLSLGQELKITGPNGIFALHDDPNDELVFVANGVGIVPFNSMMDYLEQAGDSRKKTLLWGLRYENDIFWQSHFQNYDVDFQLYLSKPESTWNGTIGRVTDLLKNPEYSVNNKSFYLCGSKEMIADAKEILRSRSFDEQFIYHEKFF